MKKMKKLMACVLVAAMIVTFMPTVFAAELAPYAANTETLLSTDFAWDTAKYSESLGKDQATYYADKLALGRDVWGFSYAIVVNDGTIECAKGLGGKDSTDTSAMVKDSPAADNVYLEKSSFNGGSGYTNGIVVIKFKNYTDGVGNIQVRCMTSGGNRDFYAMATQDLWTEHTIVIDVANKKAYFDNQAEADMPSSTLNGFRIWLNPGENSSIALDDMTIEYSQDSAQAINNDNVTLNGTALPGSVVKAYVNGEYNTSLTTTGRYYSLNVNDLKVGRNIVSVEVEAPNGDISAYTKIFTIADSQSSFLEGTTKVYDFNDMPDWTNKSSSEGGNSFKYLYPCTSYYPCASRVDGASGEEGDYAVYFSSDKPAFYVDDGKAVPMATKGKIVYDFDMKIDNNSSLMRLFANDMWHSGMELVDTYLKGTNYVVPSQKWIHYNMVYDLTNANEDILAGKWYVTLTKDGVSTLVVNGLPAQDNNFIDGKSITLKNQSGVGFAIDNFSVTNVIDKASVSSVSYKIDETSYETNYAVPSNAQSITFNMTGAVELTDGCITLNGDAVASDKISLDSTQKSVTISLSDLVADTELSFAGLINEDIVVTDINGFYCDTEIDGTSYSAKIYGKPSSGEDSITVVIASYGVDNTLLGVDVKKVNIDSESFVNGITSTIDENAAFTKTMIIDSIANIIPLTTSR